jgi:hypothetical protein
LRPTKWTIKVELALLHLNCSYAVAQIKAHWGVTVSIKETPRKRITFTSSLDELSTDPLGKRVVRGKEFLLRRPTPFLYSRLVKDDVNDFPSPLLGYFLFMSNHRVHKGVEMK